MAESDNGQPEFIDVTNYPWKIRTKGPIFYVDTAREPKFSGNAAIFRDEEDKFLCAISGEMLITANKTDRRVVISTPAPQAQEGKILMPRTHLKGGQRR